MSFKADATIQPRGAFHSGRSAAIVVPLLLAVVMVGGIGLHYRGEIYPIANWGMFSQVPSTDSFYTLLVHEVNGKTITPPRLVTDLPQFKPAFNNRAAVVQTRQFAAAIAGAGASTEAFKAFALLRAREEALFGRDAVVYEPILIDCDPLIYYNERKTRKETSYGRFKTREMLTQTDMAQHAPKDRTPGVYLP